MESCPALPTTQEEFPTLSFEASEELQQSSDVTKTDEFVFSPDFLRILSLLAMVRMVLNIAKKFSLPKPKQSYPFPTKQPIYTDEKILLTAIVMRVWRLSYGEVLRRIRRWTALQKACGYKEGKIISKSQFSRRLKQLGILPCFLLMVALVWELARRGIISGKELILDSTTVSAWLWEDIDAMKSYCGKFGFKVHTVICRTSMMPLAFIISPANRNDAPFAIPLLRMIRQLYPFFVVKKVFADAAYFSKKIIFFIGKILKAKAYIDYNVRRRGKKGIATLEFLSYWYRDVLNPRSTIERFFGIVKRYYGLNDFQQQGLSAVCQHVCLTYVSVLAVALLAVQIGREDLMRSPRRLLAPC